MALGSCRERMLRKHKKRDKVGGECSIKAQGLREARYRKARKLLKNAIAKVRGAEPFLLQFYLNICNYRDYYQPSPCNPLFLRRITSFKAVKRSLRDVLLIGTVKPRKTFFSFRDRGCFMALSNQIIVPNDTF
jgi:hypothetical protein